ncbi:DUF2271 domain-containing protein [uncultured Hyphomonas sp.]|uniref:DUF2271 domain-containing protein n=1 Tax=uncultured Hyphomonas sp. TaxID=225298 RepID=UPI002AAC1C3C|nr:DUF2271 domain-containing protein [uncultured Hyphomonas sp.]
MLFPKALLAVVLSGVATLTAAAEAKTFNRHRDHVLGTSFDLVVVAESEAAANRVEAAMLEEIARLNDVLSNYDASSEISRLNTKPQSKVSEDLMQVLSTCEAFREQSNDAISCRIGEVVSIWKTAEENDAVPDRANLRLVSGQAKRADVVLNKAADTVSRPESVVFRTDAIAKGYIIDKALEAGRKAAPDAHGMLLNIGGDQKVWGVAPHDGEWRTGISSFSASGASDGPMLSFAAGALATSGTGPRDRVIGGKHFGHIITPADGWVAEGKLRASVYAEDAMTADALSTALMVMNISDAISMIEGMEGVEASVTADDGRVYSSTGWAALEHADTAAGTGRAEPAWPGGYQLTVDLEIPDLSVAKYERPYVAVWIADADRNLIRILMLAGDEPRWMEENYYWFRRFGRKAGSLVDAMSGPTRRPGEYTLVWDGLDDDGKPVPPGDYILHIEAAREHGDHQHESLDLPLADGSFTKDIPAGVELGTVRVSFGTPK